MTIVDFINGLRFEPPLHGELAVIAYRLGRGVEVAVGLTQPGSSGESVWMEPWVADVDEAEQARLRARVEAEARRLADGARLAAE